jgi:hypothetical protein
MQSWWEVATPHRDVREGNIREDIFAADLGDVAEGKAPFEYQDAATFFRRTYLTEGLKNLLENVLLRLSGNPKQREKGGNPVIQLQTPFGGGKTHALLMLYHAVKNREAIDYLYPNPEIPKTDAKVVVFVGTKQDALKGRTPWGEMAYQLGRYELVREHDEKRISPGKDVINKVLGDEPILILIDELVEYAVKAKGFADQISAFAHELTEAVRSKDRCCLVCTLPSSAPYGEAGERALNELQMIFGRVEAIYTPVEGEELYEIIRKRLFEEAGDEKTIKNVAQSCFEMYQRHGADVPPEVKEVAYREKIEHAYPFHPELIDMLYERWGSYPKFQRTRGVMTILAWVAHDLYSRRVPSPLIQSSLVNLENTKIRSHFITYIGNEYNSVIDSDVSGKSAKSLRIDRAMGSEYEKYGIAKSIATTIFLYSFNASGKGGITLPWIRISLLREGMPSTIVGDAVNKLKDELWYLHTDGVYSFTIQPNLNRIIVDKEQAISSDRAMEEMEKAIKKYAGNDMECYLWPKNPADIPDNQSLKLALLSPGFDKEGALDFFDRAGSGYRVNKNTLFLVRMDKQESLIATIKNWLAIDSIEKDRDLLKSLAAQDKNDLEEKIETAKDNIHFGVISAYRHLALPEKVWKDLGDPTIGSYPSISKRIKQHLMQEARILTRIGPKYILDRALGDGEISVEDVYNIFIRTPGSPMPENIDVFLGAVVDGVKGKIFGVRAGQTTYFGEDCQITKESAKDFVLVRPEIAEREKKTEEREEGGITKEAEETEGGEEEPETRVGRKKVSIRVGIPSYRFTDLYSGVIQPLQSKSDEIHLTIEIDAEGEIDDDTLKLKVRETLDQIGADVEKFDVE